MSDEFVITEDLGTGELSPGSTPRRWEPEEGTKKLNERIHRESKRIDTYSNLEFSFSKPKRQARKCWKRCYNCGKASYVSINTVGMICSSCHKYVSVREV